MADESHTATKLVPGNKFTIIYHSLRYHIICIVGWETFILTIPYYKPLPMGDTTCSHSLQQYGEHNFTINKY